MSKDQIAPLLERDCPLDPQLSLEVQRSNEVALAKLYLPRPSHTSRDHRPAFKLYDGSHRGGRIRLNGGGQDQSFRVATCPERSPGYGA